MRLTRFLFACVVCFVSRGETLSAASPDAARPNIVFILADDLGYGDLGCFGQTNFPTPRIDQMAKEGMRLTQHYAGCTVCAPSRACLMTGQHTGHVFQRINGSIQFRPDPQDLTVATLLKRAGYKTALVGKSGLSCNSDDGGLPNRKGFDHFFGYTSHGAAHRYYPQFLWRDGSRVEYPGNSGKQGDTYSGDLFRADVLEWLDANAKQGPFFLHLSLQQPHADLAVPNKWKEPYLGEYEEQPFPGDHYRGEQHPKSTFAGMVSFLDDSVGCVLDKLKELRVAENTLVIFSSDNGPMNEGGWKAAYFNSGGGLRGKKRDLYEGGVRVPTIAWWPGVIPAGSESAHVSAFWDFTPTACELAGVDPPADTDGISYVAALTQSGQQPDHEFLYWEFYEQGGKQAVRMGDWKGLRLNVLNNKPARFELYDLAKDPGEQHDVAIDHPEVVEQIEQIMRREHAPSDKFSMEF